MTGIITPKPEADLRRKSSFFRMVQNLNGYNAYLLLKSKKYRHEIRFRYSENYVKGQVLEIGAGAVPLSHNAKRVDYLDYAPKEIIASHFGINVEDVLADIVGSMDDIPAPDSSYDTIAASHVLEHLEDPIKGLKECFRVLKKNGVLFLVIPNPKSSEFDFNRKILSVRHFIEEHNCPDILAKNKLYHYMEFTDKTQVSREISIVAFNERVREFVESDRRIHFHAYGPRLIIELVNYATRQLNIGVEIMDSYYFEYSNDITLVLRITENKNPIEMEYLIRPSRIKESITILCELVSEIEGVPFPINNIYP